MEEKKVFLRRDIHTIFIMLGHECNMNCKYCLQHPMVNKQISHSINSDIYNFIEQISKDRPNNLPLRLQFFGGEPLIFWKNIKEIVEEVEKRKLNIEWSLMSNGKAITEEMANFFNEHNFWICISWDGKNVLQTRGFDAFEENSKQKEILFKIKGLGVSAVISSYSYPKDIMESFQKLDDEYFKKQNMHLYMNVDDIMDTGGVPKDLLDIDYDRVYNEVFEMTIEYLNDILSGTIPSEHYAKNVFIHQMYNFIAGYYQNNKDGKFKRYYCNCGNGYNTLNLGLDGKLYPCHNTSKHCGNIYMDYFVYLNNVLSTDPTIKSREICKNCEVISYCHGGCKMVSPEARKETYCKLKKAVFLPVLELIEEYGKQIGENN